MARLNKTLASVKGHYLSEIHSVEEFIESVSNTIQMSLKDAERALKNFSQNDHAEFDKFKDFVKQAMSGKKPKRISIKHDKVGAWLWAIATPLKHQSLVGEMVLVYLISIKEAFLKDYLREILRADSRMLRSKKQVSYEEVFSHGSLESLIDTLARSEVDEMGFGGVDAFADMYERKLNVRLSEFGEWECLREASYRRNVVIHRSAHAAKIYRSKLGIAGEMKPLLTDIKYANRIVKSLRRFIGSVHKRASGKFGRPKELVAA